MASASTANAPSEQIVPAAWFEFVDKPDASLICPICSLPATDPVIHSVSKNTGAACTQIMCRACRPKCRDGLFDETMSTATATQVETLSALKVRCTGCKTVLARKDFDNHTSSAKCKFTCPYGCKKKVSRSDWSEHDNECSEKIIPCQACDVGCGVRVSRQDMKHHLTVCPYKPLQPYFQRLQAELLAYRSQITNTVGAVNTIFQQFQAIKGEFEISNTECQRIAKENVLLKRQILEESERYQKETKSHIDLARQQRDAERKELSQLRAELERQTTVNNAMEKEMREFRLSVMTELKRAQVESSSKSSDKNKSPSSFVSTIESEWTRKEAAKEPLLEGKPTPSAEEFIAFKELKSYIDEQRLRIDAIESNGVQPMMNRSLPNQSFLSPDQLPGDGADALLQALGAGFGEEVEEDADPEANLSVAEMAALYPEMSQQELEEYVEAKKLLGSLRTQLAEKLQAADTEHEEIPVAGSEQDEVNWAMSELDRLKQEYEQIMAPGADDELDNILGGGKPKLKKGNNLIDTVDKLTALVEDEENEEVQELKPLSYAAKRFQLKRAPSQAMLEYLIALPPDTAKPSFSKEEVVKISTAPAPPPRPSTSAPSSELAPGLARKNTSVTLNQTSASTSSRPVVPSAGGVKPGIAVGPSAGDDKKDKKGEKAKKVEKADKGKKKVSRLSTILGGQKKEDPKASSQSQVNYIDPFSSGPSFPTLSATAKPDPTSTPPSSAAMLSTRPSSASLNAGLSSANTNAAPSPRSGASATPALVSTPSSARLSAGPQRPSAEAPPSPRSVSSVGTSRSLPTPSATATTTPAPAVQKPKAKEEDAVTQQLSSSNLSTLLPSSSRSSSVNQSDIDSVLSGTEPVKPPMVVSLTTMTDKPKTNLNPSSSKVFTSSIHEHSKTNEDTMLPTIVTQKPTVTPSNPSVVSTPAPSATPLPSSTNTPPMYRAAPTNPTPSPSSQPYGSSVSIPSPAVTQTAAPPPSSPAPASGGYPPGYSPSTPLTSMNFNLSTPSFTSNVSASPSGGQQGYPPGYQPLPRTTTSPSMASPTMGSLSLGTSYSQSGSYSPSPSYGGMNNSFASPSMSPASYGTPTGSLYGNNPSAFGNPNNSMLPNPSLNMPSSNFGMNPTPGLYSNMNNNSFGANPTGVGGMNQASFSPVQYPTTMGMNPNMTPSSPGLYPSTYY